MLEDARAGGGFCAAGRYSVLVAAREAQSIGRKREGVHGFGPDDVVNALGRIN